MTVAELRKAIANLPDDGEVFVQRIEDFYFEENGWPVKLIKGEQYHRGLDYNKWCDRDNAEEEKFTQEDLNSMREQYIDTHCCINYDGKNLYITSHY